MKTTVEIFKPGESDLGVPMMAGEVKAGFPSPAEDFIEMELDLNKSLIQNPTATFLAKVKGNSMKDAGIYEGDILVVDRSKQWNINDIIICALDGEYTLKKIMKDGNGYYLQAQAELSAEYPDKIYLNKVDEATLFGVVTYVIHKK